MDPVGRPAGLLARPGLGAAGRAWAALPPAVVVAGAGIAVGVVAAILLSTDSILLAALPFALLALLVPLLLARDLQMLGLTLLLLVLPFEASLRVTGRGVDTEAVVAHIGLPPSTLLEIKVFPTDFFLAGMVALWLIDLMRRRVRLRVPGLAWLALAYVGWGTLSAVLKAQYPMVSAAELVHETKYFVAFVYLSNFLATRQRVRTVVNLLIFSLALEVTVTLVLWRLGYTRDSLADRLGLGVSHEYGFLRSEEQGIEVAENFRASGTFGAASHLSEYLQTVWPLALAMFLVAAKPWRKLGLLALFAGAVLAVCVTTSRSGLIALVTGTTAIALMARWRGRLPNRTVLISGYVGLALAVGLSGPIYDYFTRRPETFRQRFILLEQGRKLIAANPVLGVGPNNSTAARVAYAARNPAVDSRSRAIAPNDDLYPIHNQWVVSAAERGLVGLALGVSFLLAVSWRAWRLTASADPWIAALAMAAIASFVALGAQLMGDHFVPNAAHMMLWLWCALVMALDRIDGAPREAGSQLRV